MCVCVCVLKTAAQSQKTVLIVPYAAPSLLTIKYACWASSIPWFGVSTQPACQDVQTMGSGLQCVNNSPRPIFFSLVLVVLEVV